MPRFTVEPLPAGCPWSEFTPPNVDWCEEELCSLVVNPAGTWSNLAYVVFGLVMWAQARRLGVGEQGATLRLFGPVSIVVGMCSFAYHASYTYLLQFFDFVGMFLFCFTLISANAVRLRWIVPSQGWKVLIAGTLLSSAAVPLVSETPVPIQGMVVVLIVVILLQEGVLARVRAAFQHADYRLFFIGLALLTAAAAFSAADVTRTWCDPTNHWVQGHAIWHLLSAACLYAMFHFYASLRQPTSLAVGAGSEPASR